MNSLRILLVLLIASCTFTACGDDDDNKETLFGTWKFDGIISASVHTSNNGLSIAIDNEERKNASTNIERISLNENYSYQIYEGAVVIESGTFYYRDNQLELRSGENTQAFAFVLEEGFAQKIFSPIDEYVDSSSGVDKIILSKIKEIRRKYPEETSGLLGTDLTLLEIYTIIVNAKYVKVK